MHLTLDPGLAEVESMVCTAEEAPSLGYPVKKDSCLHETSESRQNRPSGRYISIRMHRWKRNLCTTGVATTFRGNTKVLLAALPE